MIKYLRRTPVELAKFRKAVAYYKSEGYPTDIAEQYAWDHFSIDRKIKKQRVTA